jgi:hypothetical protein
MEAKLRRPRAQAALDELEAAAQRPLDPGETEPLTSQSPVLNKPSEETKQ